MYITDNIIRNALKNVYFIWGRGKTTIANKLHEKYGFYIYRTDDSRERHMRNAEPAHQPYMCRDFEREYGVKSFWELPPEVIGEREKHFLAEFTPMVIVDLIALSQKYGVVICEGDIDYAAVISIASHTVHLCNCGTKFDWFNRPDHIGMLEEIKNRHDISETEKEEIIRNAYISVGQNEGQEGQVPDWVLKYGVKNIIWNDNISIEQTVSEVERYFEFDISDKGGAV